MSSTISRGNDRQWIESRGGRDVTVTQHPVLPERVEFFNDPDDPETGPLTLKFYLGAGHEVGEHIHPYQTETLTVNQGRIRATIKGEEQILEVGDNRSVPQGTPHGYEVISDEEAILAVSMTPALTFEDFIVASHALGADEYPENGLNLPYMALVAKRYGLLLAPPITGLRLKLMLFFLALLGRLRGLKIPDEPLPRHSEDEHTKP